MDKIWLKASTGAGSSLPGGGIIWDKRDKLHYQVLALLIPLIPFYPVFG